MHNKGPPLSPWQASRPPSGYPAQISVVLSYVKSVHSDKIGTATSLN